MGSDSDMPVMSKAADILEKLGIDYEMKIISAHREPDVFFEYAKTLKMTKKDLYLHTSPFTVRSVPSFILHFFFSVLQVHRKPRH